MAKSKNGKSKAPRDAATYRHPEADSPLRPDVGTLPQFKKRKPPVTYRYDSSLSPELNWDGQNHARETGEALIREILEAKSLEGAKHAAERLKAMSGPFLNWAGKAERLSFDVPTLPLFVHERLSTKGIIETLKGHKLDPQLGLNLFGDPGRSITDQVLKAYEYRDKWVNRMILGDSLVVMNSLLHYEGLGGQVQMIYIDPPYGVNFGSNFQPFIRKRDVSHNDDEDMTREPEMVKAYRDTWELGLHSYLTYLRDRLLLARELISSSGSVFLQISDENLHHARELMDEVFGAENFVSIITFQKTGGAESNLLAATVDYLLWFARDKERIKYRQLYIQRMVGDTSLDRYDMLLSQDGKTRRLTQEEGESGDVQDGAKRYQLVSLFSGGAASSPQPFDFAGKTYLPRPGVHWKTPPDGLQRLANANRIEVMGSVLRYRRFAVDFPVVPLTERWESTQLGVKSEYVVQTSPIVVRRCLLMTTDPGDLVLDPTCGSGTTAYVAEQWGRRWITIDTSRVPLALARQRLLTATFPYYQLKDETRGPAGGFVYVRKQNQKGEEVGGIVPHVTLKAIANDEPPEEEVLVDRPEVTNSVTRVTGPFCVEATVPTPLDYEADTTAQVGNGGEDHVAFVDRMLEVLRKSPVLQVVGNKKVTLKNVRPPAKTLSLSAEAMVANGADKNVAFVFGPENGAVSEKAVHDAAFEAHGKGYSHLYVIGFAIQANARNLIDNCEAVMNIPATYVQATPDLMMGDLLKTMRSSQIFSVCGLPEVKLSKIKATANGATQYQAELTGLDVFDPIEMHAHHEPGDNVPAWFLDTDYNGLCFHVSQAFFPRTSAWDSLKKALRGTYDEGSLGSSRRHNQRAFRGRRTRPDRGQSDRRPRQRADGSKGSRSMTIAVEDALKGSPIRRGILGAIWMLKILDLPLWFGDAENYKRRENKELLTRIFVRSPSLERICTPATSFLIGEKGTGKTAYAVYVANTAYREHLAAVRYIRETDYLKFIALKREKHLDLSDYTNIWKVIIYLLLAQQIRDDKGWVGQLLKYGRFKNLANAIDDYYQHAFSPEIIYALQFVDNSQLTAALLAKHAKLETGREKELSFSESRFQTNLLYIQREFEEALRSIKLSRSHLLFIDGIDIRPASVPYAEYLECIKGLANAVWAVNNDFFSSIRDSLGRLRVVLLVRPDIFQSLGLQNQNAKIRDNSVVLDWQTTYKEHRSSGLFEVTDQLLRAGQQDDHLQVGRSWDHYFPFDSPHVYERFTVPSSFIGFLRLSVYRPRDFVTMLQILRENVVQADARDKQCFSFSDVDSPAFRAKVAEYLLGEVKDHLLFYYSADDYETLVKFFAELKGRVKFTYAEYDAAFRRTVESLKHSHLPEFLENAETFLQFLYDLNVISFIEDTEGGEPFVRWCFRERSYSNIAPKVKVGARYEVHYGIARALNIGSKLKR